MEDVGKRSQYEEVQRYQNASTTAPYEGIDNSLNVYFFIFHMEVRYLDAHFQ